MRKILKILLWTLAPIVAFAGDGEEISFSIPEPEVLSLLGLGALGFLTTRLFKK
jgi:hypothetical protein